MRRMAWLAGVSLLLLGGAGARGSGPLGVFAVLDKVVAEPSGGSPERVRLWGTFVQARAGGGREFSLPAYGFIDYALDPDRPAEWSRREWADMQKIAGTGAIAGWSDSSQRGHLGRVRRLGTAAGEPDRYPVSYGVYKLDPGQDQALPPVRSLLTIPAQVSPVGDEAVTPGKIRLVVRNIRDKNRAKTSYWFVLESASGEKEVSDPVPAGKEETTWTPRLEVKAGEKYTWRVQAVEGDWKGPANTATFQGKTAP